jgi:predicted oxidoreductase (fatty acid repression mutant protein)
MSSYIGDDRNQVETQNFASLGQWEIIVPIVIAAVATITDASVKAGSAAEAKRIAQGTGGVIAYMDELTRKNIQAAADANAVVKAKASADAKTKAWAILSGVGAAIIGAIVFLKR